MAAKVAWVVPLRDTAEDRLNALIDTLEDIEIRGSRPQFLRDPLLDGSRFKDIKRTFNLDDPEYPERFWLLEFFANTPFRRLFLVLVSNISMDSLKNTRPDSELATIFERIREKANKTNELRMMNGFLDGRNHLREYSSHHVYVHLSNGVSREDAVRYCSQWLRKGSGTLAEDSSDHRSQSFIVDNTGLGMIVERSDPATFYRSIILFALSRAYMWAIDEAVGRLAQHSERPKGLETLYREALVFNARYFFRHPVKKSNRYRLTEIWEEIERKFSLGDHNQELIEQLDAVRRLLDEEQARKAARRERRINFAFGVLGLLIGFASLIEITPEKWDQFKQGWSAWWHQAREIQSPVRAEEKASPLFGLRGRGDRASEDQALRDSE